MKRFVLELPKGLLQRSIFPLDGETTLGRSRKNDIPIDDPAISRRHAKLTTRSGEWFLWDLSSRNGTFVNGHRIQICQLHPGDRIQIGSAHLRFLEMDVQEEQKPARKAAEPALSRARPVEDETISIAPREIRGQMSLVRAILDALPLGVAMLNERMDARYMNRAFSFSDGEGRSDERVSLATLLGCPAVNGTGMRCEEAEQCAACLLR